MVGRKKVVEKESKNGPKDLCQKKWILYSNNYRTSLQDHLWTIGIGFFLVFSLFLGASLGLRTLGYWDCLDAKDWETEDVYSQLRVEMNNKEERDETLKPRGMQSLMTPANEETIALDKSLIQMIKNRNVDAMRPEAQVYWPVLLRYLVVSEKVNGDNPKPKGMHSLLTKTGETENVASQVTVGMNNEMDQGDNLKLKGMHSHMTPSNEQTIAWDKSLIQMTKNRNVDAMRPEAQDNWPVFLRYLVVSKKVDDVNPKPRRTHSLLTKNGETENVASQVTVGMNNKMDQEDNLKPKGMHSHMTPPNEQTIAWHKSPIQLAKNRGIDAMRQKAQDTWSVILRYLVASPLGITNAAVEKKDTQASNSNENTNRTAENGNIYVSLDTVTTTVETVMVETEHSTPVSNTSAVQGMLVSSTKDTSV